MKWVLHTAAGTGNTGPLSEVFRAEIQRSDPVIVGQDPGECVDLASQALLAARQPNREAEWVAVMLGGLDAVQIIRSRRCPARAMMDAILNERRNEEGGLRSHMLSVAVTSFAEPTLERHSALAPHLADGCGLTGPLHQHGSTAFDSYLKLNFGARRAAAPYVELRSIVEWDAMVDALFASRSFASAADRMTVKVTVKLQRLHDFDPQRVQWEQAVTAWYVNDRHLPEFVPRLARAIVDSHSQAGQQPMELDVGLAMIASSKAAVQYAHAARGLFESGEASRSASANPAPAQPNQFAGLNTTPHQPSAVASATSMAGPLSPTHTTAIDSELQGLQTRRERHLRHKASAEEAASELLNGQVSPANSQTLSKLRGELQSLGQEFDEAEVALQRVVAKLEVERSAVIAAEEDLSSLQRRVQEQRMQGQDIERDRLKATEELNSVAAELDRKREQRVRVVSENNNVMEEREAASSQLQLERDTAQRRHEEAMEKMSKEGSEALARAKREREQQIAKSERDAAESVANAERQASALRHKLMDVEEAATMHRRRVTELEGDIQSKSASLATLRSELHALQTSEENVMRRIHEDVGPAADTRRANQTNKMRQRSSELREQLTTWKAKKTALIEARRGLGIQYESVRVEYAKERATLVPKWSQQLDEIQNGIGDLEEAVRANIEADEAVEFEELLAEESENWFFVLRETEVGFLQVSVAALRQKAIQEEKDLFAAVDANKLREAKLETIQGQIEAAKQSHAAAISDNAKHLAAIAEEETALAHSAKERTESAELAAQRELLEAQTARLRSCLAQAATAPGGTHKTGTGSVAGRAAAFHVLPSVPEMAAKLADLIQHSTEGEQLSLIEQEAAVDSTRRNEREIEERRAIHSQIRSSIATAEERVTQLKQSADEKERQLDDLHASHNGLQAQLKEEFRLARTVINRHRDEAKGKLATVAKRTEELQGLLRRSDAELRTLRGRKDMSELQNSLAHESTIRMELDRETRKNTLLRQKLAEASGFTHADELTATTLL